MFKWIVILIVGYLAFRFAGDQLAIAEASLGRVFWWMFP
jgi:hypothetical protein